jgi:ATP-dependent 26S proteasome regulatory subunit
VRNPLAIAALVSALLAPVAALANTVDATLIPDGTYIVKVEKVADSRHILVKMDNGIETTLSAKGSVDFSKVKSNDTVKLSVTGGKVPVYLVQ